MFNIVSGIILVVLSFGLSSLMGQEESKKLKPKAYGQVARLEDWVTALAWSADGKRLAIGTYEQTLLWDRESKKVTKRLPAKYGYVRAIMFTPDGSEIYTGCYQSLEIYDVQSGKRLKQIKAHGTDITKLAWLKTGETFVSSSKDRQILLWQIDKSIPEKSYKFEQPVYDFQVSKDESLLAVAMGDETRVTFPGQAELISLESGESILKEKFPEQARYASSVLFSQDEKYIISGSNDSKGYVYDIATGKALGFFGGHKRPINGMLLIPGSNIVMSVSGGRTKGKNELKVWNFLTGDELVSFEPHTEIVNCVAMSPDKQLVATGGQDKTAIIWEMSTILNLEQKMEPSEASGKSQEDKPLPPSPGLPE